MAIIQLKSEAAASMNSAGPDTVMFCFSTSIKVCSVSSL